MLWRGIERRDRPCMRDAAEIHHRHTIREVMQHVQIMRDEQQRQAKPALQPVQQIADLRLDRDVQRTHRQHQQVRLHRQCARDADARALAAGKVMRVAIEEGGVEGLLRRGA
ncbi:MULTISPECIES: hypothetical protein [Roseomonadaceae]|uniref:Uncharacterized protein n=1 Tax=Falsiroseomonas oleicola TaxID=2801474 RepID=A0ABS6H1H0_9PROT|nr:hypothetical protein [Roseomonas oleicola]MBU8542505.1 hypothetical protein [Roseomonas oleicola]